MKTITAKLGKMRKACEWVVYPYKEGDTAITIQSDNYIAAFNIETGEGVLSKRCSSGAYFRHLNAALGAKVYQFSQELIDAAKEAQPQSGDTITEGGGITIIAA